MIRLALVAVLFAVAGLVGAPALAQPPAPPPVAGTAPAPLNNAGTVVLLAQTVDATLREADDGSLYADVQATTKLHNTSKTENARPFFGWPFSPGDELRFDPAELSGFHISKGAQPISLTQQTFPADFGSQPVEAPWLVTEQSIGRDERVAFESSWRQPLAPPGSPLVTFRYGLLPAGRWAAPVGSARITLQLPELTGQEQIVSATPISPTFTGDTIEWLLVEEEPSANIGVTLIAPALWRDIQATRARIAAEPSDVDAYLHLADLYQRLADAGLALYDGEAEATLIAAREAAPDNPEPHWRLAERYQGRIGPIESPDLRYLELTAEALDAALRVGLDGDRAAAARTTLVAIDRRLADLWLERGDTRTALAYLDRAAQWASGDEAADLEARRREAVAQTVLDVLNVEGIEAAIAFAAEQGLPTYPEARPPLRGLDLNVRTGPDGRYVAATLVGDEAPVATLATELQAALGAVPGVEVGWQPASHGGTLELRWGAGQTPDQWRETGRALAAALPDRPSLDLLRSALSPDALTYLTGPGDRLSHYFQYEEQLALTSRSTELAEQVRVQAEAGSDAWERALLGRYAEGWQAFSQAQSATYEVTFIPEEGQPLHRRWQPAVPGNETLSYVVEPPRLTQMLQLVGAGLVGLLVAIAVIWRWPVYR